MLPTITPSIGFEPAYAAQPLGDFLGSLAKVRALPDLRLLPAHGPVTRRPRTPASTSCSPTTTSGSRLCLAAAARRPATAYDVAGDLPWTRHEQRLDDLDAFNAALAVDGDDGAPRAAGRAGRGHPHATTTA